MSYPRLWLLALLGTAPALAQPSIDQILEKYTEALGGRAACEKVTTRTMKGTVTIPDDNVTGTAQVYAAAPERYRVTLDVPEWGGQIETVLDGENGWQKNPDSGVHAMSRADLANARRDYHFYRELRLKELFPKMDERLRSGTPFLILQTRSSALRPATSPVTTITVTPKISH